MPFLAVAAIISAGAVGAGIVAASTVIYAGIAVSVVGKVTHSKELSQIGSGMTLGAGLASAATSIFGAAEGGAGAAGGMSAENAALGGADGLGGTGVDAAAGSLGSDGVAASADVATGATAGLGDTGASTVAGAGDSTSAGGLLNPETAITPPTSAPLTSTPATAAPSAPASGMSAENAALGGADGMGGTGAIAPPANTSSNGIAQWWSKQPDSVKNRIMQVGGQAFGSLFDGWTNEQKMALQREQMNLDKQKYDTSVANASAQPTVRFQPYTPATGGLLNPKKG